MMQSVRRENAPAPAAPGPQAESAASGDKLLIETRFGLVEFDRGQSLAFARPIPGFPNHQEFGLTPIPNVDPNVFMLLQSIEPADLSFIVVPYMPESELIAADDLQAALTQLGVQPENLAMLLIANFRKEGENTVKTVNLRAPIIIDASTRRAWQCVLPNERYPVRHPLG